jgi:hypothetical protein
MLLRREKHSKGVLFMINSDTLEINQCFLEFPEGSMIIAEADGYDFKIAGELSRKEANLLRKKLNLNNYNKKPKERRS